MTLALVDERLCADIRERLSSLGYRVIAIPRCKRLPTATASHPDMLLFILGDTLFAEEEYLRENADIFDEISALCPALRIKGLSLRLGATYPQDAPLNILRGGNTLYARRRSASEEILREALSLGMRVVDVNQGYPACTVLMLGDSHAITSDRGMAKLLTEEGVRVLLISDGDVLLPPYEYGFIGGASGVVGDEVLFLGDINTHRDAGAIISFCREAGYTPVSLGDAPLSDLGRILFIDTEEHDRKGE